MAAQVKIIKDSISEAGVRLTTFQLRYWRAIHAELLTHRVFSRNASSSRAIPVKNMLEQVRNDPAMPIHWGLNKPGMQADEECSELVKNLHLHDTKVSADVSPQDAWIEAAHRAADVAEKMMEAGYHKQIVNRLLEPFQYISVVLTATEFGNWFELRAHENAQPEIQELATLMRDRMNESTPTLLRDGEWHLPYVTEEDYDNVARFRKEAMGMTDAEAWDDDEIGSMLRQVSAARCCRVSYLKHDGSASSIEEDIALCDRLAGSRPIHASPFEHQATPDRRVDDDGHQYWLMPENHGNLRGWIQNRKLIEKAV